MTCCLHCFGMEFWSAGGGGGSKYLDCLEWETYQKVSWFHAQSSFSLYVFVTQACVLYAEWPRVNNLPGQTTVSQFLTL